MDGGQEDGDLRFSASALVQIGEQLDHLVVGEPGRALPEFTGAWRFALSRPAEVAQSHQPLNITHGMLARSGLIATLSPLHGLVSMLDALQLVEPSTVQLKKVGMVIWCLMAGLGARLMATPCLSMNRPAAQPRQPLVPYPGIHRLLQSGSPPRRTLGQPVLRRRPGLFDRRLAERPRRWRHAGVRAVLS